MYDVLVIGGGVNGCGIARDAAGRGLKVLLVEKDDLASATSSASTKLIHGGLRYLEQYDFKLVAESLRERERLLKSAPHIIWPLDFVLPHEPHLRPFWLIRLGLFIYDSLARRDILKASKGIDFKKNTAGRPLRNHLKRGVSYADCWVEDARLVVLCAMDAHEKGTDILTRTECISLKAEEGAWHAKLKDHLTGEEREVRSKCVINAAGPWVREFIDQNNLQQSDTLQIRHSKGSHIVIPKLYEGEHAYILQQPDQRIVFTIPYERNFTLIGTTDAIYNGDPHQAEISDEEKQYLCDAVNRSFEKQVSAEDVVWHYSGVRPLLDSGDETLSKVTRDYKLDLETSFGPPLLHIFGGKLTTFRKLSEQAVDQISSFFSDSKQSWTETSCLPGGDIEKADFEKYCSTIAQHYLWASEEMLRRYVRAYGVRSRVILAEAKSEEDMGQHYGDFVYEAEIRYLIQHEWARTLDDVLWRRSKLGLHISLQTKEALEQSLPALVKEFLNDK